MKAISILVAAILAACSADTPADPASPDAAIVPGDTAQPQPRDPHEQVSVCDPAWNVDGVAPAMCDVGCQMRPHHPIGSATSCQDTTRPCYVGPACADARSGIPIDSPRVCDETFELASGHIGCCVQRVASTMPTRYVPTFYRCPPPLRR